MRSGDKVSEPASSKASTSPSTATTTRPPGAGFYATFALDGVFGGPAGANGANGAPDSTVISPRDMQLLQRTAGNRAVSQLLQRSSRPRPQAASPVIQRKLAVGAANDPLEREAERAAKHVSGLSAGRIPSLSKLTHESARPVIRRKVFFEVEELQQKNVADLEIIKVNSGERPAFIKNRWQTLAKGKPKGTSKEDEKEDYRHIVSFDLIKKALHQVLKNKTVDEAAVWLGNPAHWIDQNFAHLDMFPPEMLKTVQGAQAAAENWLRNANSYEANLWLGPRKENRQKGLKAAQSKGKIREMFADGASLGKWNDLKEVIGLDKTIGAQVPFVDDWGLQFENLADFKSRWNSHSLEIRLDGGGAVLRATPGSDLSVTIGGPNKLPISMPALYVVSGELFRVGRSFQIPSTASIMGQTAQQKADIVKGPLKKARDKFIESQLDPSPAAVDKSIKATGDSLPMYDTNGAISTVVDVALSNSKYVAPKPAVTNTTKTIQFARLDGQFARLDGQFARLDGGGEGESDIDADPHFEAHLEADIQRASAGGKPLHDNVRDAMEDAFGTDFSQVRVHTDPTSDRLNRSVNAKAFTTGHNIFFRQEYYKPQQNSGRELLAHELAHVVQQRRGANPDHATLQRKVHFELREKQKPLFVPFGNAKDTSFLKWKIKHVEISGRPPVIPSRQKQKRGAKEDYRHVVSFNLIAKALRKVLKGMSIEEASAWLRDQNNWIDQTHAANDMLDARYMTSIQGVQMAAENWIKNANSFQGNLWAGSSKENRSKGGEAAGAIKKISNQWVGPKLADITNGELQARSSNGAKILFEDHNTKRFTELDVSLLNDKDVFTATMGGTLVIVHPDKSQTPLSSAIFVKGNALHKVGRQFQQPKAPKALKKVGKTTKEGELYAEAKKPPKAKKGAKSDDSTGSDSSDATKSPSLIKSSSSSKNSISTKSPALIKSSSSSKNSITAKSSSLIKSSSSKSPPAPTIEGPDKKHYKSLKLSALKEGGVYKAPTGGKLHIIYSDTTRVQLGVAIFVKGQAIYQVGRQFQKPMSLAEIQVAHLKAQHDSEHGADYKGAMNTLTMRDKNKKQVPVTAMALGKSPGKYLSPEQLGQFSQPVVTYAEAEVQKEIAFFKEKLFSYIKYRAGNWKFDQLVWQKLGLGFDDIERIFSERVIPNCKVKSDVNKQLQQTWAILNLADIAASQMAELDMWVRENYRGGDPAFYIDELRVKVYQLARNVDFKRQILTFCEKVKEEVKQNQHQPAFDSPFSIKGPMSQSQLFASLHSQPQYPPFHHDSNYFQGPMSLSQSQQGSHSQQQYPPFHHDSNSSRGSMSLSQSQRGSQQREQFPPLRRDSNSSQGSTPRSLPFGSSQPKAPYQPTHSSPGFYPPSNPFGASQAQDSFPSSYKPVNEIKRGDANQKEQQTKKRQFDATEITETDSPLHNTRKKLHLELNSPIVSNRPPLSSKAPMQSQPISTMAPTSYIGRTVTVYDDFSGPMVGKVVDQRDEKVKIEAFIDGEYKTRIFGIDSPQLDWEQPASFPMATSSQIKYIGRKVILHNDNFTDSVPATIVDQKGEDVLVRARINGELKELTYPSDSAYLEWL